MPHDPGRVAECRAWFRRARSDLDAAAIRLGAPEPRPESAVFHCQQAVEKAWKAFLVWHVVPFRKTRDLRELGEACVAMDGSLKAVAERAEQLTPLAWVFRYPGEPEEPPLDEAAEALALARQACETALTSRPEEVWP
ncbi:MAG: HEPN domain-containing protein [Chloroflexia bacterium]